MSYNFNYETFDRERLRMVKSPKPLIGNNVTKMKLNNVHSHITDFLRHKNIGKGNKLEGTAAEYERDIRRFFQIMLNKTTDQLEVKDLDISKNDVKNYQTFLVDNGYKSS